MKFSPHKNHEIPPQKNTKFPPQKNMPWKTWSTTSPSKSLRKTLQLPPPLEFTKLHWLPPSKLPPDMRFPPTAWRLDKTLFNTPKQGSGVLPPEFFLEFCIAVGEFEYIFFSEQKQTFFSLSPSSKTRLRGYYVPPGKCVNYFPHCCRNFS